MKHFRNFCRILVGVVFIFSGFVKGVDPLGTVFRMNDYFVAFGMSWAVSFSLPLTIILCMLEFVTGISLLFNLWIRGSAWVLLVLMIYFTLLTFFDALFNLVPDCGCFGEALKLTNVQTFLKNLILLAFVIPVFVSRKKFNGLLPAFGEWTVLVLFIFSFSWMMIYAYRHLPIIDFMDWKTGNVINKKPDKPVKFYITFKNKKTGEEKEYLSSDYPWRDSTWMKEWKFKSQRVEDPNTGRAMILKVDDDSGNEVTSSLIDNPDYQFLLVAYDLPGANKEAFTRILPFFEKAEAEGHSFVCITSSNAPENKTFRISNGCSYPFYSADDIVLETMIRSNPGLILIKNGKVLAKWSYRDFPAYEDVKERYMGNR